MTMKKNYNKSQVLIVGAGPAGLATAIHLKTLKPAAEICVIDKAADLGNHNLSGAVLEPVYLHTLLNSAMPDWQDSQSAKSVLENKVEIDDLIFMPTSTTSINISLSLAFAKLFHLPLAQMRDRGNYVVSISKLTKWLGQIAAQLGVEVLTGFAAEEITVDESSGTTTAVKLIDQGRDKHGNKQPNFVQGEIITADFVVLAEGCDGLLTEKFIEKAKLIRRCPQLCSIGVKELIKVTSHQYEKFGSHRVVHAMGYPLWTPLLGPAMFGGGIIYPADTDNLAVGIIVAADWKYFDFSPQDALANFKKHPFVKQFIQDGTIVEAGAKMIPEGGFYAIPRSPLTKTIGRANTLIIGDSAGLVNMLKIKGLHNAIGSGLMAAKAIAATFDSPCSAAANYTDLIDRSQIGTEMQQAKNFRQTVARLGPLLGLPLSQLGNLLPRFNVVHDYKIMTTTRYRLKPSHQFDKNTFTAMAGTGHREDQPNHLRIIDINICRQRCTPVFNSPCITFCPAGVYETVDGDVKPANPSNCLHCKTCQRKCPFDNIRWTTPEGTGGPRYKRM
jgi:electron-transferring-flavoprotein dehydrogenase